MKKFHYVVFWRYNKKVLASANIAVYIFFLINLIFHFQIYWSLFPESFITLNRKDFIDQEKEDEQIPAYSAGAY